MQASQYLLIQIGPCQWQCGGARPTLGQQHLKNIGLPLFHKLHPTGQEQSPDPVGALILETHDCGVLGLQIANPVAHGQGIVLTQTLYIAHLLTIYARHLARETPIQPGRN